MLIVTERKLSVSPGFDADRGAFGPARVAHHDLCAIRVRDSKTAQRNSYIEESIAHAHQRIRLQARSGAENLFVASLQPHRIDQEMKMAVGFPFFIEGRFVADVRTC